MIERLRRKIIAYSTVSIFTLLLLILGGINVANFATLAQNADQVTELLASEGGQFQEGMPWVGPLPEPGSPSSPEGERPLDPIGPETRMSTRYFTVKIDANGQAGMVKMALTERSVSEAEAISWGASLAGSQKGWTRTYYRFRTYAYSGFTYVSVIDYSRELSPSYRVLWSSLLGSAIGVLAAFLILLPLSKLFVKPLETSIDKQRRFIQDASHELKTPLTIISANNEIAEMEHGETDSTKAIGKQVARLNVMVKNLNTLARMDSGEQEPMVPFDLAPIAADVVEGFRGVFASSSIDFTEEIPDSAPIEGDPENLRKLLTVFLDNASKYAKSHAEFHLYKHGDRTVIKVMNDAEGIEDGPLDQVFERFYRSDTARASSTEGSGIGLSIAKEIVQAHHGRIMAKGEAGNFIVKAEL